MNEDIWAKLFSVVMDSELFHAVLILCGSFLLVTTKTVKEWIIKKARGCRDHINAPHIITKENAVKLNGIDKELLHIKLHTGAYRASILQFHNGESFSINNPIFKFSCTHEQVRRGYSASNNDMQGMLVSRMLDFVGPLLNNEERAENGVTIITPGSQDGGELNNPPIFLFDIRKMEYSAFVHLAENYGMNAYYACLLKSSKKKSVAGILVLQFPEVDDKTTETINKSLGQLNGHIGNLEFMLD